MYVNDIRTGFDELINFIVRIFNHQMTVNWLVSVTSNRLNVHHAHREIRHKCAVHNVAVKNINSGIIQPNARTSDARCP